MWPVQSKLLPKVKKIYIFNGYWSEYFNKTQIHFLLTANDALG